MDYDKVFDGDIDRNFFYTDYPGNKLMVGSISLANAKARMSKGEYYVLVTYHDGEELPKEYMPLPDLKSEDDTYFATVDVDIYPGFRFDNICQNGGIQRISRLKDIEPGNPNYLLGPGPETVALKDLVTEQFIRYNVQRVQDDSRGR